MKRRAVAGAVAAVLGALAGLPQRSFAAQAPSRGDFRHGRLFRIERAGVPASHAFGTLHSADPRVLAVPAAVTGALDASRTAAFETLLAEGDVAAFFASAQYDDERRLTDHVDAATVQRIHAALGPAAPDRATLARVKPWAVLLMLAQVPANGAGTLDGVLKAEAQARRLSVVGLELPDEQVASLDAIPLASQLALMHWALDTQHRRERDLEATTRAWLAGELASLWRLSLRADGDDASLAPHFAVLLKHVVTDRNVLLAHRLHLPLRRGRVFVAVGALHLYGASGLLALIARQGYRVTRVA